MIRTFCIGRDGRDNLGKKAPKIYLVGWLGLSVHRRRMLEDRNVMLVDLAALPQGKDWPRDQRHRYARQHLAVLAVNEVGCDRISLPRNPQGRKIATNNFGIREMSD